MIKRADKCSLCKFHHDREDIEDGWYCGAYRKWTCNKSEIYKDYSIAKKEATHAD